MDSRAAVDGTSERVDLRPLALWLLSTWLLVWAMVGIGGVTRLTGSGLSMVEWHPLMGALPPLSADDWTDAFERYQRSPQYLTVNHWMSLSDFKRIFFWEYVHRLFGRLIGAWFVLPFVYFALRRRLVGGLLWKAGLALVLGGSQGLLGWYMVKSGLVDEPRVSHIRLAAHLLLAFVVGAWLFWTALDLIAPRATHAGRALVLSSWLVTALVLLQVVLGAFMAGTGAGRLSATFPDMNGAYLPRPFFHLDGLANNLLNNPFAIHWTHRALAWVLLLAGAALVVLTARRFAAGPVRNAAFGLAVALALQFSLGIATVMYEVPVALAVAHQLCGYLLWSTSIGVCHRLLGRGQVGQVKFG